MASAELDIHDTRSIQIRLSQGDRDALLWVYDRYYEELFRYGMRIVMKEDIVREGIQELFLSLWDGRKRLREVVEIKPYLLRMLRNKLYDILKQTPIANPQEKQDTQSEPSIEDQLIDTEHQASRKAAVAAAFLKLSPRQREMIHLRFSEGFTYEEIEEITAISYQSIRNLVSEGLRRMRKLIPVLVQLSVLGILH